MTEDRCAELDLDARVKIPRHVVYRDFPAETVILNLETGRYHGLNPTGGRILASLGQRLRVREAVAALAKAYNREPDDVECDVRAFCVDLLDRGLIELEPATAG